MNARVREAPRHEIAREGLERGLRGPEPLRISRQVLAHDLAVVTRPQVWPVPSTRDEALVPRQPFLPIYRRLVLPVHLLGRSSLAALLGCVSPVAGDVEFQDDGVVHDPVDGRSGGHGVGEYALPL